MSNFLAPSNLRPKSSLSAATTLSEHGEKVGSKYKVALEPGHSQLDWHRVSKTTPRQKLSGFQKYVPVSKSELAKHRRKGDMWMGYKGMVYNVSAYIPFHPGGIEEILRGGGLDATRLIDEVHAWVNVDKMLENCRIGILREDEPPKQLKYEVNPYDCVNVGDTEIKIELDKCIEAVIIDCNGVEPVLYLLDSSYTLAYTIDVANVCMDQNSDILKFVNGNTIVLNFKNITGKPELTFQPLEHDINFEIELLEKESFSDYSGKYKFRAIGMKIYKNDQLKSTDTKVLHVQLQNENTSRPYSLMESNTLKSNDDNLWDFDLYIKTYKAGKFTKDLAKSIDSDALTVGLPKITDEISKTRQKSVLAIGGGTGIAPMQQLVNNLLKNCNVKA